MRTAIPAVFIVACLALAGCRNDPAITALERENRYLEDEIYELQDVLDRTQTALDNCRRENLSMKKRPEASRPGTEPPASRVPATENRGPELAPSQPSAAVPPVETVPPVIVVPTAPLPPGRVPETLGGAKSQAPASPWKSGPSGTQDAPAAPGGGMLPSKPSPSVPSTPPDRAVKPTSATTRMSQDRSGWVAAPPRPLSSQSGPMGEQSVPSGSPTDSRLKPVESPPVLLPVPNGASSTETPSLTASPNRAAWAAGPK